MAEIDTSIYKTPPPPNPMELVNPLIAAKQGMVNVQSSQFDLSAKQLLAKAMQMSIDPATGMPDTDKLMSILAQPEFAPAATAGVPLGLDVTGKKLTNTGIGIANTANTRTRNEAAAADLSGAFTPMLTDGKPHTHDEVAKALDDLLTAGRLPDPAQYVTLKNSIPDDPAAIKDWLGSVVISKMPGATDLTPAVNTATGQETQTTKGAAVAGASGVGGAPVVTKLGPLSATQAAAADAVVKQGLQANNTLGLLNRMEAASEGFSSGPFTNEMATLGAAASQLLGIQSQPVADIEDFRKLAKQMVAAQGGQLGTDLGLMTASGANPNEELSNLGIKEILHMLEGNAAAEAAQMYAFNDAGAPATDFLKWRRENWDKHFDPRVYQIQFMKDPAELAHFRNQLIANGQWDDGRGNGVYPKWVWAIQQGLVPPPRKSAPQ